MDRALLLAFCLLGCSHAPSSVRYDTTPLADAEKSRFVICGDTRSPLPGVESAEFGGGDARRALFAKILELQPDFVLNPGDLVAHGHNEEAWDAFDQLTAGLRSKKIRYVPALGNHEYMGRAQLGLQHYFARFPDLDGRKFYVYDAGFLQILILDSNFGQLTRTELLQQRQWLERRLTEMETDPSINVVLLAFHHPPYTNDHQAPEKLILEQIVGPARAFSKVRAIVSGHVHSYERFEVAGLMAVVSGGCGAPPVSLITEPGQQRLPPAYRGPAERDYHLVLCEADHQRIDCQVHGLKKTGDWYEMDQFQIGTISGGMSEPDEDAWPD